MSTSTASGGLRTGRRGRPPVDLYEVIATVQDPQTGQARHVTRMDRVREVMRVGGFDKDAAARCGVLVDTYRDWIRTGTRARADVLHQRRKPRQLTAHERQCVDLAIVVEEAEAEGRLYLFSIAEQLSRGGIEVKTVTEKVDMSNPQAVMERTTKVEHTLPDSAMIRWRLAHRWPQDFNRSVHEVTGEGGGPVQMEVGAVETLLGHLDRIAASKQAPAVDPGG